LMVWIWPPIRKKPTLMMTRFIVMNVATLNRISRVVRSSTKTVGTVAMVKIWMSLNQVTSALTARKRKSILAPRKASEKRMSKRALMDSLSVPMPRALTRPASNLW